MCACWLCATLSFDPIDDAPDAANVTCLHVAAAGRGLPLTRWFIGKMCGLWGGARVLSLIAKEAMMAKKSQKPHIEGVLLGEHFVYEVIDH